MKKTSTGIQYSCQQVGSRGLLLTITYANGQEYKFEYTRYATGAATEFWQLAYAVLVNKAFEAYVIGDKTADEIFSELTNNREE